MSSVQQAQDEHGSRLPAEILAVAAAANDTAFRLWNQIDPDDVADTQEMLTHRPDLAAPVSKLRPQVQAAAAAVGQVQKHPLAVLTMGGSFNPPHMGHVACMVSARDHLVAAGYWVLGGFLEVSPMIWTHAKLSVEGKGNFMLPTLTRALLTEAATADIDWLVVSALEVAGEGDCLTDAVARFVAEEALLSHGVDVGPVTVFKVFGLDDPSMVARQPWQSVLVCRPGLARESQPVENLAMQKFVCSCPVSGSSTRLRTALENKDAPVVAELTTPTTRQCLRDLGGLYGFIPPPEPVSEPDPGQEPEPPPDPVAEADLGQEPEPVADPVAEPAAEMGTTALFRALPADAVAAVCSATNCGQLGAALDLLRTVAEGGNAGGAEMTADLRNSGLPGLEQALDPEAGAALGSAGSCGKTAFFGSGGLLEYIVAAARPAASVVLPMLVPKPATTQPRPLGGPVVVTAEIALSRADCEMLLARAFLCALRPLGNGCGTVSCATLLACPASAAINTAAEKLRCLLGYFESRRECNSHTTPGTVRFVRTSVQPGVLFQTGGQWWSTVSSQPLADMEVVWGQEMQELRAAAVVDFANEQFGYGIIPSCTQEEMLMMARPEALVGCALSPVMAADEAIIAAGAQQFVHCRKPDGKAAFIYRGRCEKEDTQPALLIGVDASKALLDLDYELSTPTLRRDVEKLLAGFEGATHLLPPDIPDPAQTRASSRREIVTGAWGCGAFGCDPGVKLLQQLLAASIAGVGLRYCAYGVANAEEYARDHAGPEELYGHLRGAGCTVGDLWELLLELQADRNDGVDMDGQFCMRRARRWRLDEASCQVLDARDRQADAERASIHASTSQPCRGGCGFALPLDHATGFCGICANQ